MYKDRHPTSCLICYAAIVKELNVTTLFVRVCTVYLLIRYFQIARHFNRYLYKHMGSAQINKMFERKIMNILLFSILNICFGYSKELSHRESSFNYPQHVLIEKNENIFKYPLLSDGLQ